MKRLKPSKRKLSSESTTLTPDEVTQMQPIMATKPIPSFLLESDEKINFEISLKSSKTESLILKSNSENISSVKIQKENGGTKITGSINPKLGEIIRFGNEASKISPKELSRTLSKEKPITAFRPEWLNQNYAPTVIPHSDEKLFNKLKSNNNILLSFLQRVELSSYLIYPWCTIGKIFTSDGLVGTGTIVGPNLMITASHVAPWDKKNWWMKFIPAYNQSSNPSPFGYSYVEKYYGINKDINDVTGVDYVICKLYNPLGNSTGWMGSQYFGKEEDYYNGWWYSIGYPDNFFSGQRPAIEYFLRIEDIDNDKGGLELETKEFSSGGWSGGPLWGWIGGQPKVIGVMSGNEDEAGFFQSVEHSVSSGGRPLVNLVNFGHANWRI